MSFAIGNPGLGDVVLDQTITEGIVSAAEREISGHAYIQHTAAVNPGNSGGSAESFPTTAATWRALSR